MPKFFPCTWDIDERHRLVITQISELKLEFKIQFRMDNQQWVTQANLWLDKEQCGVLAFTLLDTADELEGKPLKRPRKDRR